MMSSMGISVSNRDDKDGMGPERGVQGADTWSIRDQRGASAMSAMSLVKDSFFGVSISVRLKRWSCVEAKAGKTGKGRERQGKESSDMRVVLPLR